MAKNINWLADGDGRGRAKRDGFYIRITKSYISISHEIIEKVLNDLDGGEVRARFGTSPDAPGTLFMAFVKSGGNLVSSRDGIHKIQSPKRVDTLEKLGFNRGEFTGKYDTKAKVWSFQSDDGASNETTPTKETSTASGRKKKEEEKTETPAEEALAGVAS